MVEKISPIPVRNLDELKRLRVGSVVRVFDGSHDTESKLRIYEGMKERDGPSFIEQNKESGLIEAVASPEDYLDFWEDGTIGINVFGIRSFVYEHEFPETSELYIKARNLIEKAGMWEEK